MSFIGGSHRNARTGLVSPLRWFALFSGLCEFEALSVLCANDISVKRENAERHRINEEYGEARMGERAPFGLEDILPCISGLESLP